MAKAVSSVGLEILASFDVPDDARDFLAEIIDDGHLPADEDAQIRGQGLMAETDDFHALIDCATSIHRRRSIDAFAIEGNDVLTSLCHILHGTASDLPLHQWHQTDCQISRVRELQQDASLLLQQAGQCLSRSESALHVHDIKPLGSKRKRQPTVITSHYWSSSSSHASQSLPAASVLPGSFEGRFRTSVMKGHAAQQSKEDQVFRHGLEDKKLVNDDDSTASKSSTSKQQSSHSPYFPSPPPSQKKNDQSKKKRPPPGTVSCIPFPPLTADSFGLVQERFAREPFWLLVAVTFLIRTKGRTAVPVFLTLKERFSRPADIADVANAQDILDLISHLGLGKNRLKILQKYARLFTDDPPRPGVVHRVRKYDSRDLDMSLGDKESSSTANWDAGSIPAGRDTQEDAEAWEIGHMTQGKYALDSWRIFCRDELLGRATDWKGSGRGPDFQPEWMRVRPDDKELRAYLRWMNMREGWEWDPSTGERAPLREEMRRAVNEGRVEYDDGGGLRIIPLSEGESLR